MCASLTCQEVMSTSTNPNIVIALAANKADMEAKQQVSWEKAERFAQQQGLPLGWKDWKLHLFEEER